VFLLEDVIGTEDLFTVLYGLSHVGQQSSELDAITAFRTLCIDVPGGLEHFLEAARPSKDFQRQMFFHYVWDVDAMAELVEKSPLANDFSWYSNLLRTDAEMRTFVESRTAK
jgi:hypothetical protein